MQKCNVRHQEEDRISQHLTHYPRSTVEGQENVYNDENAFIFYKPFRRTIAVMAQICHTLNFCIAKPVLA